MANRALNCHEQIREPIYEALRAFVEEAPGEGREDFVGTYLELLKCYETACVSFFDSCDSSCQQILADSIIPDVSRITTDEPSCANNREQDLQHTVRRKFLQAMDKLQKTRVPKKYRGNLPKEAVEAFRRWFDEHDNHPCTCQSYPFFFRCVLFNSYEENLNLSYCVLGINSYYCAIRKDPTNEDKAALSKQTGVGIQQVSFPCGLSAHTACSERRALLW